MNLENFNFDIIEEPTDVSKLVVKVVSSVIDEFDCNDADHVSKLIEIFETYKSLNLIIPNIHIFDCYDGFGGRSFIVSCMRSHGSIRIQFDCCDGKITCHDNKAKVIAMDPI